MISSHARAHSRTHLYFSICARNDDLVVAAQFSVPFSLFSRRRFRDLARFDYFVAEFCKLVPTTCPRLGTGDTEWYTGTTASHGEGVFYVIEACLTADTDPPPEDRDRCFFLP